MNHNEYPEADYTGHVFTSTRGMHFEFDTREEAEAFYQDALCKGHRHFVLEGTMVIRLGKKAREKSEKD